MTASFFEAPGQSERPGPSDQEPASRRGRPSEPIGDEVGIAHRGWLVPSRRLLNASGLTLDDLAERVNYSKPRLSELLRGKGLYPRWEITSRVGTALGVPMPPLQRQWISGAREAGKKQTWIDRCVEEVPARDVPWPLPLRVLTDRMREPYTEFAGVFLLNSRRADLVVAETFDILWMCWDLALASDDTRRYAWTMLRARVLPRAPLHPDGRIDLSLAALFTQAYAAADSPAARQAQLQESVALFDAIGRLPHNPLDAAVLRYLCCRPPAEIPDILGVTPALARVYHTHARQILEAELAAHPYPGGNAS